MLCPLPPGPGEPAHRLSNWSGPLSLSRAQEAGCGGGKEGPGRRQEGQGVTQRSLPSPGENQAHRCSEPAGAQLLFILWEARPLTAHRSFTQAAAVSPGPVPPGQPLAQGRQAPPSHPLPSACACPEVRPQAPSSRASSTPLPTEQPRPLDRGGSPPFRGAWFRCGIVVWGLSRLDPGATSGWWVIMDTKRPSAPRSHPSRRNMDTSNPNFSRGCWGFEIGRGRVHA